MLKRAHTGTAANVPTGVEFAWWIHAALENWTATVDAKASILLAFEGGAFIFAVTTRSALISADPPPVVTGAISLLLLGLAMASAATVVLPVLGSSRRHGPRALVSGSTSGTSGCGPRRSWPGGC